MSAVQERIVEIVNDQPEDSSYSEILDELFFNKMIKNGLRDSKNGSKISHEEMKEEILKWQS